MSLRPVLSAAVGSSLGGATGCIVVPRLQFHATWSLCNVCWHAKSLLSIALERPLRHLDESLLDAGALDSAGLVEQHVVVFTGPLFAASTCNLPLLFLVQFVTDADEGETLRIRRSSVLMEAITPARQGIERRLASDIVDESAAVCTAIECVTK